MVSREELWARWCAQSTLDTNKSTLKKQNTSAGQIILDSGYAGPHLWLTGGVHGNEPVGVLALLAVCQAFDQGGLLSKGRLTLTLGNPDAFLCNKRLIDEDLNRAFGAESRQKNPLEARRAQDLYESLTNDRPSFLLDFHSVSSGNFQIVVSRSEVESWAERLGCVSIHLSYDPKHMSGKTLIDAAIEQGVPALVVECGQHQSPHGVDVALRHIERLLEIFDMRGGGAKLCATERCPDMITRYRTTQLIELGPEFKFRKSFITGDQIEAGEYYADDLNGPRVCNEIQWIMMPSKTIGPNDADAGWLCTREHKQIDPYCKSFKGVMQSLLLFVLLCYSVYPSLSQADPVKQGVIQSSTSSSDNHTRTSENERFPDRASANHEVLNLPKQTKGVLQFDGQRAMKILRTYVDKGHRYYAAPQRPLIIESLVQAFRSLGWNTDTQTFKVTETVSKVEYQLTNIIARITPNASRRILIGTHWDTRLWAEEDQNITLRNHPIPGANDGTSGLAVILELARVIKSMAQTMPDFGVDLVLFDGEEFGRPGSDAYCQGSKHFVAHLDQYYQTEPEAVIIIDMVGDRTLTLPPEKSSFQRARGLTQLVWREAARLNATAFTIRRFGPWIVDDHTPFQKKGIPALLLIDYEYPEWHTHQDTPEKCSAESLAQVGTVLLSTIQVLSEKTLH